MSLTTTSTMTVYRTPDDRVELLADLIELVNSARTAIQVIAYALTWDLLVFSLCAAHQRGVIITVIVDRSEAGGVQEAAALHTLTATIGADRLQMGTSVLGNLIHDKVLIIDADAEVPDGEFADWRAARAAGYPVVVEGSFNFSANAPKQMNTCTIIPGKALARAMSDTFTQQWAWMVSHPPKRGEIAPPVGIEPATV